MDYDTVTFDGLHISVADLKKSIMQQKKIGKSSDFDLQITNAQTKEVYEDDESLIPKNTSVIVARVPVVSSNKKSWERNDLPLPVDDDELSGQINFDKVVKSADLVNANASEEDKVKAMISQSSQEYDPSKYLKCRSMTGPLPPTYTCFRCGKPGHWIKNCPTNNVDIKRSTGIPRSFMVPVDGPEHKGALLTSSGEYAVPLIDHVAYKEVKREKPPFVNVPEPEAEPEAQIPEELLCMVCRDLLQDAVLIPCCGNSFCDECVRQVLLDSDNHECPLCHETGISPDTVIPNRFLRTAVLNFRNETGYTRMKRMPSIPFPQPSHMDSPQPSPDSTVENQAAPQEPVEEIAAGEESAAVPITTVPAAENVEPECSEILETTPQPPDPPVQKETEENVEPGNEDLQPGTPLADEPPVHNVPETELTENEQYPSQNQYEEENKFSYSHYYNENMDSDSRDEGHVLSSEINQISTIETITTRVCNYKSVSLSLPLINTWLKSFVETEDFVHFVL